MSQTNISLASTATGTIEPTFNEDAFYLVDFTKIESVNDLVLIFAAMGITFHGKHPHFQAVKKFVDLSKPINPTAVGGPQPERTEMKLPKLKKID